MRFDLVVGDLQPLCYTLPEQDDPIPDGTLAYFGMTQADGSRIVFGRAVITDPNDFLLSYVPQSGDTDTPGVYRAQWRLVYPNGRPDTFPSDEPLYVVIHPTVVPSLGGSDAVDSSLSIDVAVR